MPKEDSNIVEVENNHPLKNIYNELRLFLESMCATFEDEEEIIEKVCRFVKHTMRCLNFGFSEFLLPLFNMITVLYEVNKHFFFFLNILTYKLLINSLYFFI